MSKYIELLVGQSEIILIEVSEDLSLPLLAPDVVKASPPSTEEVVEKAKSAFSQVVNVTRSLAKEFSENLKSTPNSPDEVELGFGIKIDAVAGAIVAQAGVEANFTVSLKWKKLLSTNK